MEAGHALVLLLPTCTHNSYCLVRLQRPIIIHKMLEMGSQHQLVLCKLASCSNANRCHFTKSIGKTHLHIEVA